jgi:hypothetical protein
MVKVKFKKQYFLYILTFFFSCSDIKDNTEAISDLKDRITQAEGEISAINALIAQMKAQNEADISAIETQITSLTAAITVIQSDIADLEGVNQELLNMLNDLMNQLEDLQEQLEELKTRVQVVEARVDENGNQVITLIKKIDPWKDYVFGSNINKTLEDSYNAYLSGDYTNSISGVYAHYIRIESSYIKDHSSISWSFASDSTSTGADYWTQRDNVRLSQGDISCLKYNVVGSSGNTVLSASYDAYDRITGSWTYNSIIYKPGTLLLDMPCGGWFHLSATAEQTSTELSSTVNGTKHNWINFLKAFLPDEVNHLKIVITTPPSN